MKRIGIGMMLVAGALVGTACDGAPEEEGQRFRESVLPVLEARCAAGVCHGITAEEAAGGAVLPDGSFVLEVDDSGAVVDWRAARDAVLHITNTTDGVEFSTILRKPLPQLWGGLAHQGGDNFTSPKDPGYIALRDWLALQTSGGEDPETTELTAGQRYFADEVQPMLVGRGCAVTNCHGPTAFIPFRIDPGIPDEFGVAAFSREMTLANYEQLRPFLSLDGDPMQSRLLRKSMPLGTGGIVHRGGNRNFFATDDDPAIDVLTKWANLERESAVGDASADLKGLVFVRGPVQPARLFDPSDFVPGRDIVLVKAPWGESAERNLTTEHHAEPADIRDPDGSPEATHIAFSMRKSEADAHRLYELEIKSGELRALTSGAARTKSGRVIADLNPTYGPDGYIYFVSNRHDVLAERGDALDYDVYRVPREGGDAVRLTFTPAPELGPALFRVGSLHDYVVFSYRRAVDARDQTVGFSFPVDRHVDYHIFFGITADANLVHQFEELPDGRALSIVADVQNVWEGGQLAVIDRNLGPDFPADVDPETAAVPAFAKTLQIIDTESSPRGISTGPIFRDPVAAPDGSIFFSRAVGPFDLSDELALPNFGIVHARISESGPVCGRTGCFEAAFDFEDVVADDPETGEFDPEPLYVWAASGEPREALDPEAPTLFSMSDVAVNDGIMADLAPVAKQFREDVKYLRFVEAIAAPPTPKPFTRGQHMPARILGEVELADDGSVFVQLPPNTPFRTQLLNKDRMSVGVQHNRWLFAWPGQHFKQSSPRMFYDQLCGGCHGAQSGAPEELLTVPQITTSATVTLSRYDDANPRLPLQPETLDDATRTTVTFADVQPILDRSCATSGCHDGTSPVDLTATPTESFSAAYEALVPDQVDTEWGNARRSPLIEVATGRQLNAPGDPADHPAVELTEEEILTLVRWIEVGAPFTVPE